MWVTEPGGVLCCCVVMIIRLIMRLWHGGGDGVIAQQPSQPPDPPKRGAANTGAGATGGSRPLIPARGSRGAQCPAASTWPQACSSASAVTPSASPSSQHRASGGHHFPELSPIQALLRTSDVFVQVLSMLNAADRVSLLSVSKWIRNERHAVIQKLDLRMPIMVAKPVGGRTRKALAAAVASIQQQQQAKVDTVRSILLAAPQTRRLRYRGEVEPFSQALDGVRLARLASLDLCECNMTPVAARHLALAIRGGALPRIQHLDVSDNPNIGEDGGEALGNALRSAHCPKLQGLLLFGSKIRQRGGLAVAAAIRAGALPALEILDLSGNAVGTAAVVELAGALYERHCPRLEQLGLSDNEVGPEAIRGLAQALLRRSQPPKPCSRLEKLHLGGNQVGVEAARDLAEVLRIEECGGRLALLELHSAKLTGQGVKEMAAAFRAGACKALKELWLDDNVDNEEEAVRDVIEVLRGGALPSLEALGLNWTALGSQGAEALCEALRAEPRPALQRLDLRSTSITPEGVAALGQALAAGACPSLRWLDLSGNAMFREGAKELASALEAGGGKALRRLDLHAVGLEAEGMSVLAQSMSSGCCREMQGLGLALNHMGPAGAQALARSMLHHAFPKLVGLELHKNDLGCGGAASIASALQHGAAPLLIYLGLSMNGIGDEGARHLADVLRTRCCIHLERLNLQDNGISRSGRRAVENAALVLSKARGRGAPKLKLEMTGNDNRQKGGYLELTLRWCRLVELPVLLTLMGLMSSRGCAILHTLHQPSAAYLDFHMDQWLSVALGIIGSMAAGVAEGKAVSAFCARFSLLHATHAHFRLDSFCVALLIGLALGLLDFYTCRQVLLACCGPALPTAVGPLTAAANATNSVAAGLLTHAAGLFGHKGASGEELLTVTAGSCEAAVSSVILGPPSGIIAGTAGGNDVTAMGLISACFVMGFVLQLERSRRRL